MAVYIPTGREKIFIFPADYDPLAMIAVGYLREINRLPENIKQRELNSRKRLPLEDIVFKGVWDNRLKLQ